MTSVGDTYMRVTNENISLLIANYLKLLIKIGLKAATSLDPHNTEAVISNFLANVEKATQAGLQSDIQQRFQHNDYVNRSADFCTLCQTTIEAKPGQGCYWTGARVYHIDCINCPSCNGPPKLVYADEGKSFVECSFCEYGSMMAFISQNFGHNLVILHSRSKVFIHLLYVAWARLAITLRLQVAPCM